MNPKPKQKRRSQWLSFAAYTLVGLVVFSVRDANLTPPDTEANLPEGEFCPMVQPVVSSGNQQLDAGKNVLSAAVAARATYMLSEAQKADNAREWLNTLRGNILGRLSNENDQRGGIWSGIAEDNAKASLIVDSLAVELALVWVEENNPNRRESYGLGDYLLAARAAGGVQGYDSAAIVPYLSTVTNAIAPQEVTNEDASY